MFIYAKMEHSTNVIGHSARKVGFPENFPEFSLSFSLSLFFSFFLFLFVSAFVMRIYTYFRETAANEVKLHFVFRSARFDHRALFRL